MVRYYIVTMLETNTGVNFTYQSHSHTSFSIGDLHPFYTYQFYVRAVTVEVGPLSTAHTVTTLEDGKLVYMYIESLVCRTFRVHC